MTLRTVSLSGTRSDALNDQAVIRNMKAIIQDKLRDGVMACYGEARGLQGLDPDQVMEAINKYFSPTGGYQQDNFTEAFAAFDNMLSDGTPGFRVAAE
jgi:hypothetical protein